MTGRIEQIGNAVLFHGDCREIMSSIVGVDVIVTDPVWPNCPAGAIIGADRPWELWAEAVACMPERQRVVVVMRCDSDPRFLSVLPEKRFVRVIHLPYVMPGYLGRVLGGDEFAYWFGEPIAVAKNRRVIPGRAPPVQPGGRPPNGHPMSRAQAHFDWLLYWCSDPGETVLDPFMGSGTTGVACDKLNRPFVGIEIDETYFDIACRRIEAATKQGELLPSLAAAD